MLIENMLVDITEKKKKRKNNNKSKFEHLYNVIKAKAHFDTLIEFVFD